MTDILYTAIIIDDEPNVATLLKNHLAEYPQIQVSAICHSAIEGVKAVKKHQPDLVFLDIEMPGGNGFDFLESVSDINFHIIFTTAYNEYALQAIKFSALDYLLKPISPDDLKTALDKFFRQTDIAFKAEQVHYLMKNARQSTVPNKIAIPEPDSITFVDVSDIIRCKSEGSYTQVFLKHDKKILASKPIGEFEDILQYAGFFRIHRSHLININEITKYIKGEGGYIILSDGSEVEVSRRKKQDFLDFIGRKG